MPVFGVQPTSIPKTTRLSSPPSRCPGTRSGAGQLGPLSSARVPSSCLVPTASRAAFALRYPLLLLTLVPRLGGGVCNGTPVVVFLLPLCFVTATQHHRLSPMSFGQDGAVSRHDGLRPSLTLREVSATPCRLTWCQAKCCSRAVAALLRILSCFEDCWFSVLCG